MPVSRDLREERRIWQSVFCNSQGKAVLGAILNRMGFFSSDPSIIDPRQIATANWILNQIGSLSVENLPNYVGSLVDTASSLDIDAYERAKKESENV